MTNDFPWLDIDDHPPTEIGIYAVVRCWDLEECLTDVADWDGSKWDDGIALIYRSPWPFFTKSEAGAWGDRNDRWF